MFIKIKAVHYKIDLIDKLFYYLTTPLYFFGYVPFLIFGEMEASDYVIIPLGLFNVIISIIFYIKELKNVN